MRRPDKVFRLLQSADHFLRWTVKLAIGFTSDEAVVFAGRNPVAERICPGWWLGSSNSRARRCGQIGSPSRISCLLVAYAHWPRLRTDPPTAQR